MSSSDRVLFIGNLKGHNGWVTSIAAPTSADASFIVSASRDRTAMVWSLSQDQSSTVGHAVRRLIGHSHFVQDVTLSKDGKFALTASWDRTLRLWNLESGKTAKKFIGHESDVLSCAFSPDDRQIVSGGRDKCLRVWNTIGDCKATMKNSEWISCVRFVPPPPSAPKDSRQLVISAGWDRRVCGWDLQRPYPELQMTGHSGYVNAISVSPDGSICASTGKDGEIMLWELSAGKHLFSLAAGATVNALAFSPNRFWLCAGVGSVVKIFDLQTSTVCQELSIPVPEGAAVKSSAEALSIAWSANGELLFVGYTDGDIRVWKVISTIA